MMRRLVLFTAAIFGLGALPLNAMATPTTGLNAPIQPSTPTVGSEIKRGADAAERCSALFTMPTNAAAFTNCIDSRQSSNRQTMGTGYEAYDVGIYFVAKMNLNVAIDVLGESRPETRVIQAKNNLYDVYYRQARDKLNLTDADAQRAALIGS